MIKGTVKINKANGQKFANISKDSSFEDGEIIEISKVKELTEKDLDKFYEENKDKLKTAYDSIMEIGSNHELTHEYRFAHWFSKKFDVKAEWNMDEPLHIECGECHPDFDNFFGNDPTINESEKYINFGEEVENLDFGDCRKEESKKVLKCIPIEDEEGNKDYSHLFNEDNINIENVKSSMYIQTYINLMNSAYEISDSAKESILYELGFEDKSWAYEFSHCNESMEVYKHKELDIYLCIDIGHYYHGSLGMFLCLDKKNSKEIYIK